MLALPCCRRSGNVDWDGGSAEGASATGSEEFPPTASTAACGGGGASVACPPLTWWPSAEDAVVPAGGIGAAQRAVAQGR